MSKNRAFDKPLPLPFCEYPKAQETKQHGLQPLPEILPLVDFVRAQPYRSMQYRATVTATLEPAQLLQMAREVATSFVRREPMTRHITPPKHPPPGLMAVTHADQFGIDTFGPWIPENILYWFIRLFVLTDPTSPKSRIQTNNELLKQSLAIVDNEGQVIGGAFNESMPPVDVEPPFREDDVFMAAAISYLGPLLTLLELQDIEAISALSAQFPKFRDAYAAHKVGHHFMVARSDALSKEDTFELVAATMEHYQDLGYEYVVSEASNQWTGAAFEALAGVRVHFAPFQRNKTIQESAKPLEGTVTSPNGFISNKDSGSMFYVIRLK